MYKIGEFSKITNLTIKALHYYDEQEILKPSLRCENNYRLYDEEDFKKAKIIVFLKKLDFSIKEIKDVIDNYSSNEDITYFLREKRQFIENKIKKQKEIISIIDNSILPNNKKERKKMNYQVEEKEYCTVTVISVNFKGEYADVGKYIGDLYKEANSNIAGPSMNLYYDDCYEKEAKIELCIPLKKKINSSKYNIKELTKIKAISTIHKGNYETINDAYKAIIDYAKERNLELEVPSRLIYHKGPGMIFKGNPDNYITEVVIPIKVKS